MDIAGAREFQQAESLFMSGWFADAQPHYQALLSHAHWRPLAHRRLGHIALLDNRLADAGSDLTIAYRAAPEEATARLLADLYLRSGDYDQAARFFAVLGRRSFAALLRGLARRRPYAIEWDGRPVRLPFAADSMPLARVRVNGREAHVLIDTAAQETVLDAAFARRVGVQVGRAAESAVFAGGSQGAVRYAPLDELALGGITLRDLPAQVQPLTRHFRLYGEVPVEGIVGTGLLSNFTSSFDFAAGALVLERGDTEELREGVPFYLAASFLPVTRTRVGERLSVLQLLDTGLSGADLALAPATAQAVGTVTGTTVSQSAESGGGQVPVTTLPPLSIGVGALRRTATALGLMHFPLEYRFGFRLGGVLGHTLFSGNTLTLNFRHMRLLTS